MNESNPVNASIRSFIVRTFAAAKRQTISDDLPLLESGIIDSLGVLDVVTFLEHTFAIKVSDEELIPEHFASVQSLAGFVEAKQRRFEVSAE
jgi:acyl carrier protein